MLPSLGKWLVVAGIGLAAFGSLLWLLGSLTGVGKLPGDLVWRRGGVTIYFPLATSIILSLLLTLIVNLIFRNR